MRRAWAMAIALVLAAAGWQEANAQLSQSAVSDYVFDNLSPAYSPGAGPLIIFSSRDSNFVRKGRHDPLAQVARSDGFRTRTIEMDFTSASLDDTDILAIINPFLQTYRQYPVMLPPSAFSAEEIETIHAWVEDGGSLLILADHAPAGGGSSELAARFGFSFLNGHVIDEAETLSRRRVSPDWNFEPETGLNTDHPITDGGMRREPIKHFYAFGGQAFLPPEQAEVLLRFPAGWTALFAWRAAREFRTAERMDASGTAQGAVMDYGKGRIAVFTEAGGFSAQQISDGRQIGFNAPQGKDNPEFVLSVLRWLARYKPGN